MSSTTQTSEQVPPLRILILEDVPLDASLIESRLRGEGFSFAARVVATEEAFRLALEEFKPDLVLSDFNLPGFDGMTALSIAREFSRDTPFIFVSGAIGEENVVELLRAGASDLVVKYNLSRLGQSVFRALQERAHRIEARRATEALRETIEVLHGTKRSFKSRTLGELREKLQRLVETTPWW